MLTCLTLRSSAIAGFASCALLAAAVADDSTNSLTAPAAKKPTSWEKGNIQLGGIFPVFNSDLIFGIEGANNGSINAEDVLGLESTLSVFRVGAMYRPGETRRHQLDFSYASYDRDGSAVLTRDIEIGGETYPVGATVDTVFNFDIIRAIYSYAVVQNDRARVALGLGLYVMPLKYGVEIQTSGGNTAVEGAETTLPLPMISARGEFQIIPKLFFNTSIDGMYLEISDFRGAFLDFNVGLEYRPWEHIGFGLGYNLFCARVEGKGYSDYPGVNFVGSVDVRYSGLMVYGKWSF